MPPPTTHQMGFWLSGALAKEKIMGGQKGKGAETAPTENDVCPKN
jgi:hypothetical protein